MSKIAPETKAAVLALIAEGYTASEAARRHGVGHSTAAHWAKAERKRRGEEWEHALAGGHWAPNRRGVQVRQPCFYASAQTCTINHQENRNAA